MRVSLFAALFVLLHYASIANAQQPIQDKPIMPFDNEGNISIPVASDMSFIRSGLARILSVESLEETKDIKCPTDKNGLEDGWIVFSYQVSRQAAIDLNFFVSAELSADDQVSIFYLAWYKEMFDEEDIKIGNCGAGVKLAVKYRGIEGQASVSLPFLAASGQMNSNSTQVKLKTFGMSGPGVDRAIPSLAGLSNFDVDAYSSLLRAMDSVTSAANSGEDEDKIEWTPRWFDLTSTEDPEVFRFLVGTHVLASIRDQATCRAAKKAIPDDSAITNEITESIYKHITGVCSKRTKPDAVAVTKASELLKKYKLAKSTE